MATERTLSIIKPDGVEKNLIGEIYKRFEGRWFANYRGPHDSTIERAGRRLLRSS